VRSAALPLLDRSRRARRRASGPRQQENQSGFVCSAPPAMLRAFRDALREHGYVEGQNLSIVDRWPQGSFDQISDLATELVHSDVDIIVAWATPAALGAKAATATLRPWMSASLRKADAIQPIGLKVT
jgi:hypothetical protein